MTLQCSTLGSFHFLLDVRLCAKETSTMSATGRKVLSKELRLIKYCSGWPTEDIFQVVEQELELQVAPGTGDVLLQLLWISVDPYLKSRMDAPEPGSMTFSLPSFELGKPIVSRSVLKVIASDHPDFVAGDFVLSFHPLKEYAVRNGNDRSLRKLEPSLGPLTYNLGILDASGLTAWVGLLDIGQPRPGEQVFVTAASGAVGLVVGQLAKIKGCRVVGSVGSDEKVELLKSKYGFDDAFNYKKESDWDAALDKYFPSGIDVYFENVGGRMLEAVLNHVNLFARIPVCGMISQYNLVPDERDGVRNLFKLISKAVRMEGFTISTHTHRLPQFAEEIRGYIKEGKMKYQEHVIHGIENFPKAFIGMLQGANVGKTIVKVADP